MSHIVGRDKIIEVIQRRLEKKSILFVAERRVGKTTVLDLLNERHNSDKCIMIYRDLEKVKSIEELEEEVYQSVKEYLDYIDRGKIKGFEVFESILSKVRHKDIEYRAEKNWKDALANAIKSICSKTDKRVVLLWDELPYMLQNIYEIDKKNGTQDALALVDTLRALDSEIKNLRFVFTGSIGLHHITKVITDSSNSEPFNNLDRIELQPLTEEYAKEMIINLLREEKVNYESDENIIHLICSECDGVPFYMEKIIKRLGIKEDIENITFEMVKDEIELMIVDYQNELEMEHFVKRLEIYYDSKVKDINDNEIKTSEIAKLLLDYFASEDKFLTLEDCFGHTKTKFAIDNPKIVANILALLVKDYYLTINKNQEYQFTFSVIKRWWLKNEVHSLQGDLNG